MDNNAPMVVKIHDVNTDKDYINWIEDSNPDTAAHR